MTGHTVSAVIGSRSCVCVPGDTTVHHVAELMKNHHISAVLVTDVRLKTFEGICTERDIVFGVVAAGLDAKDVRVASIMTASPRIVSPESPFGHALHLMYEGGFHHVPVVKHGYAVGLISSKDASNYDALQFNAELLRREEITVML